MEKEVSPRRSKLLPAGAILFAATLVLSLLVGGASGRSGASSPGVHMAVLKDVSSLSIWVAVILVILGLYRNELAESDKWRLSIASAAQGRMPKEMIEGFRIGPRLWNAIRDEPSLRDVGGKIGLHFESDGRHYYAAARSFRRKDLPIVAESILFRRELNRLIDARAATPTSEERILYAGFGPLFYCPATHAVACSDGSRFLIAIEDGRLSWMDFVSGPMPAEEVDGLRGVVRAVKMER